MSTRENRIWGMLIGVVFVIIAVAAGIGFSFWAELHAASISDRLNTIPNLQR